MLSLRYAADSQLELDLENDALVAVCDAPRGEPVAEIAATLASALAHPLGYPPLVQAALSGDRVVLALEPGVPQAAAIVSRTIARLVEAGVRPGDITVVRTAGDLHAGSDPLGELPEATRAEISSRVHDPRDRDSLSYLAASAEAMPIYMNRAIFDADLVISIGVLRLPDALGYHGVNTGLYPLFSDAASQKRFRSTKTNESVERTNLRKQADEVGWLLGSRFTIQVVPGDNGDVLDVLCGEADAVLAEGTRRCQQAWNFAVPERADLVLAAIGGDASQQTWENVGRALRAAGHALGEAGDVILCTQLSETIGPALQRIIGADDLHVALREIARERPVDTLAAGELVRALERGKVFLVSDLADEVVEDLGLLPLAADSVSHVAGRYDSCIVLANAQYAQARPTEESAVAGRIAGKRES